MFIVRLVPTSSYYDAQEYYTAIVNKHYEFQDGELREEALLLLVLLKSKYVVAGEDIWIVENYPALTKAHVQELITIALHYNLDLAVAILDRYDNIKNAIQKSGLDFTESLISSLMYLLEADLKYNVDIWSYFSLWKTYSRKILNMLNKKKYGEPENDITEEDYINSSHSSGPYFQLPPVMIGSDTASTSLNMEIFFARDETLENKIYIDAQITELLIYRLGLLMKTRTREWSRRQLIIRYLKFFIFGLEYLVANKSTFPYKFLEPAVLLKKNRRVTKDSAQFDYIFLFDLINSDYKITDQLVNQVTVLDLATPILLRTMEWTTRFLELEIGIDIERPKTTLRRMLNS